MRNKVLLAVVALLAIPAFTYAAGSMTLSGVPGQIPVGGSFTLTVGLSSDVALDGLQWKLAVDGGANDGKFTGQVGALGDWFTNGFTAGELTSTMTSAVSLAGLNPDYAFKNSGTAAARTGSLLSYTITAVGATEGFYSFGFDAANTILVPDGSTPQLGSFRVQVIPEPASALLLLAAVPFLRRRHA